MEEAKYEAPKVEVVGSISDLTQVTKHFRHKSDGYYLGVGHHVFPLGS